MKMACPNCGVTGSAELFLQDAAAREAVAWALALPAPLAKSLLAYIGLFRPIKNNSLSWDRVAKLLGELQPMIEGGSVRKKGRDWPVTVDMWRQAFSDMLDRRESLSRPLKNHNYLLEILVGLADKAEGQAERQKEEDLRFHTRSDSGGSKPAPAMSQDENELAWVRHMLKLKTLGPVEQWIDRMMAAGRNELAAKGERLLEEATNGT